MTDAIFCHKKTGMGTVSPDGLFVLRGRTKMDEAVDRFNLRATPKNENDFVSTYAPRLLFFTTAMFLIPTHHPCHNSTHRQQHSPFISASTNKHQNLIPCLGFFVLFDLTSFPSLALYLSSLPFSVPLYRAVYFHSDDFA